VQQQSKTIAVSVRLPETFKPQDALARIDLYDNSPGAQPFTKLASQTIFACKSSGQITATFTDVPPVGAYTAMTHVQVNRETYDYRDCFQDMRPGDFVTPLVVPINVDENAASCAVEIRPIELIEHPPLLGEAY